MSTPMMQRMKRIVADTLRGIIIMPPLTTLCRKRKSWINTKMMANARKILEYVSIGVYKKGSVCSD